MPTAGHLLSEKGNKVLTTSPQTTILEATRTMDKHGIGALVVADGNSVIGIFTERDLMRRVVVKEIGPAEMTVGEVMTSPVYCCQSDTRTDALRTLMREKRIRHIPVVDDGQLAGMLSIGDLNVAHEKIHEETILYLQQFMYHA